MVAHIRNVRLLSLLSGVVLAAWAVWGLATQDYSSPVVTSWLIVFALAFALVVLAATFGPQFLGGAALGSVSVVFVLYSLAWLFLGGVEDAGGYWPGIIFGIVFLAYANHVSYRSRSSAG